MPGPTAAYRSLIRHKSMLASAMHALQPDMELSHEAVLNIHRVMNGAFVQPRQPSMSPSTLPRVKVKPLNLQQQQLPSRFSPLQEPPSLLRGSLTHRGSTTPRRDSSTGIPR